MSYSISLPRRKPVGPALVDDDRIWFRANPHRIIRIRPATDRDLPVGNSVLVFCPYRTPSVTMRVPFTLLPGCSAPKTDGLGTLLLLALIARGETDRCSATMITEWLEKVFAHGGRLPGPA